MEVQIIRICKYILILTFLFSSLSSETFSQDRIVKSELDTKVFRSISGVYLSWLNAKKSGNYINASYFLTYLKEFIKDDDVINDAFSSSLNYGDWETILFFAQKIQKKDYKNFFANLVLSTDQYLNNNFKESERIIRLLDFEEIDANFKRIILGWISYGSNLDSMVFSKMDQKSFDPKNCIPMNCLHNAFVKSLKGDKEDSEKLFNSMSNFKSVSYRILEVLFVHYVKSENMKMAEEIYNKLKNLGLTVESFEKTKEKLYLFSPVEKKEHGLAEIYFNIAGWFYENEMYKFSTFFSNIGLRIRPDFTSLKFLLANNYEKLSYYSLLNKFLDEFDQNSIYDLKLSKIKLKSLNELKAEKKTIETLTNLIIKYPDNKEFKLFLADSLRNKGEHDKSIVLYDEIIRNLINVDTQHWNIFYSRGISYERTKQWNLAENDFMKALELNPDAPYVLNYLGYSWLERGVKLKKALSFIQMAFEIKPNDAYITDSLGWAYYLLGNYEKSIKFLENAIKILPSDPTLNDHLGDVYWKVGRRSEALSQWKRVLLFDPEFELKKKVEYKISYGL